VQCLLWQRGARGFDVNEAFSSHIGNREESFFLLRKMVQFSDFRRIICRSLYYSYALCHYNPEQEEKGSYSPPSPKKQELCRDAFLL
jgi:hypothetical protein